MHKDASIHTAAYYLISIIVELNLLDGILFRVNIFVIAFGDPLVNGFIIILVELP